MNYHALTGVMGASIEPASSKLVALVLAWHANADTGEAWPSVPTLASECTLSESSVKRALRHLLHEGLIRRVLESRGGGWRNTTRYAFDLEALRRAAEPVHQRTPSADEPGQSAPPQPVHPCAKPRPQVAPEIDEGKATPSPSSNVRAPSVDASSGTRGTPRAVAERSSAKVFSLRPTNPKQPLSGERAQPLYWLNNGPEVRDAMGVQLGLGTFQQCAAKGMSDIDYTRTLLRVWQDSHRRDKAEAKRAKRAKAAARAAGAGGAGA